MAEIAYVARGTIPPSPPPPSEVGVVRWLRENLFSSTGNTILTLVAAWVVVEVFLALLPWLGGAVWNAGSLSECRAISPGGACLAVINERFNQFLFGFYPAEGYWRPSLAFLGLLAAIAPVLFTALPRKMLWFSGIYPLLAYWLIFGGSVWGPLMVLAAVVAAAALARAVARLSGEVAGMIAGVLAAALMFLFAVDPLSGWLADAVPIGLAPVSSDQIGGFTLTLIIGVTGIAGSLPIGIVLALGRQSNLPLVKALCVGFIEFIRGVPLITLLFVAHVLLNIFLPPGTEFDKLLRVLILVTLFASAYIAEVIRGGLAALPKGQYEAAAALGLDYWKSMRLVILPQALKISIPGIVNTFIGLFKDTTLVSVIAMFDPLGIITPIRADQNWNGIVWELYGFVALFFFICCYGMSRYSMYLERRLKTDHR
ncbi:MAG: amino acid ABC transporter permease [Alphaproteobacteria bacterium]|nr:MAG: amino acid ABC transporter permease [Alphaproteobacteria bacterium]